MRRHQLPERRRLGESKPQRANAASAGAIEPDDAGDDAIDSARHRVHRRRGEPVTRGRAPPAPTRRTRRRSPEVDRDSWRCSRSCQPAASALADWNQLLRIEGGSSSIRHGPVLSSLLLPPMTITLVQNLGGRPNDFIGRARHAEGVAELVHAVLVRRRDRAADGFLAYGVGATPVCVDVATGEPGTRRMVLGDVPPRRAAPDRRASGALHAAADPEALPRTSAWRTRWTVDGRAIVSSSWQARKSELRANDYCALHAPKRPARAAPDASSASISSGPKPASRRISALCSPSRGGRRRMAPGVLL